MFLTRRGKLAGDAQTGAQHALTAYTAIAVVGIHISKNSFHIVELDGRGAIVLRQKWSRGQVEARFANMPRCLIGMHGAGKAHALSQPTILRKLAGPRARLRKNR